MISLVDRMLAGGLRRNALHEIRGDTTGVRITIDDDGVGFPTNVPPWSIASRVSEIGGDLEILADRGPGAHVIVTVPNA